MEGAHINIKSLLHVTEVRLDENVLTELRESSGTRMHRINQKLSASVPRK